MERNTLHSIAGLLFEAMDLSTSNDTSADELELLMQETVSQLAAVLLQDFVFPTIIDHIQKDVEGGLIRCSSCNSKLQLHKRDQSLKLKTIFADEIAIKRNQYYCRGCCNYRVIADQKLHLVARQMTPRLALVTALCGASFPYEIAEAFLSFLLGVKLSAKTVENVTKDEELLPEALKADPLDNPPGVVCMDGVLIRGRKPDQWLEMKVGSFFSQVGEVSKNRREVMDA